VIYILLAILGALIASRGGWWVLAGLMVIGMAYYLWRKNK